MAQKMWILPVRCGKCGALFDLWYDLNEQEDARRAFISGEQPVQRLINQSLCWKCRNETEEYEQETDEEFITRSFEMLIDFE